MEDLGKQSLFLAKCNIHQYRHYNSNNDAVKVGQYFNFLKQQIKRILKKASVQQGI